MPDLKVPAHQLSYRGLKYKGGVCARLPKYRRLHQTKS